MASSHNPAALSHVQQPPHNHGTSPRTTTVFTQVHEQGHHALQDSDSAEEHTLLPDLCYPAEATELSCPSSVHEERFEITLPDGTIGSLPVCYREWWFGSPGLSADWFDQYHASARKMQQHRQRLQDYKKLKLLKFSLLYPRRIKLKAHHSGLAAQDYTIQDDETVANIQDFISKAIRHAVRLVNNHESRKALCASAKPIRVHPEQPFGSPGYQYQDPIIRLPLDELGTQYAVFDPLD
jgi:hypothetical protein